ncbi:MAG: hypothetical protein JWO80_412 [Bryobacterales bacterium]|jgi:uncharacterized membrane protein HdeD (DUF308 family)|nr:hypothetical protein [Bryobacterales bacterium]
MRVILAHNWWSLVLRGILGIAVGVVTFAWPGITLAALVILFGAYSLVDGVVSIVGVVRAAKAHERWGALLFEGIAGIAVGIVTMLWPAITAFALVLVIGAWAIVTGVLEIVAAIRLRNYISGEWLLLLSGTASLIFGVLIMIVPVAGAVFIALWVGAYAFISGILMIALGFRLRSWGREHLTGPTVAAPAH